MKVDARSKETGHFAPPTLAVSTDPKWITVADVTSAEHNPSSVQIGVEFSGKAREPVEDSRHRGALAPRAPLCGKLSEKLCAKLCSACGACSLVSSSLRATFGISCFSLRALPHCSPKKDSPGPHAFEAYRAGTV